MSASVISGTVNRKLPRQRSADNNRGLRVHTSGKVEDNCQREYENGDRQVRPLDILERVDAVSSVPEERIRAQYRADDRAHSGHGL